MSAPDPVRRLSAWLFDDALPLWAERGVDAGRGSFIEALAADGAPLAELDRRVLVQARQIYVFSHASLLGWRGPGIERARAGFAHMAANYWHPEGGWCFAVSPDGVRRDLKRRTYDQAFAIFACAWYFRAGGDRSALEWAERTLAALDGAFAHPSGGYREGLPDSMPRRQNPHMHLLEALLALYAASGKAEHLERARTAAALFPARFYDARHGIIHEELDDALRPLPGATRFEPGHHFEWAWLLGQFAQVSGGRPDEAAQRLVAIATRLGTDPADGLIWDGVTYDGQRWAASKRIWPQCEALRAAATLGDRARVAALVEALFRRHLAAVPGLWHERLGADGTPRPGPVPATSLYHLFGAVAALDASVQTA